MNKLFKFVFQRISKKTIFPILVLFFLPFIQNESKGQETIDQKIFVQEIVPEGDKVFENYLDRDGKIDYILGVGDVISISLVEQTIRDDQGLILPSLTKFNDYLIEGDGTIFLPRFNKLFVEGLTKSELKNLLEKRYKKVFL